MFGIGQAVKEMQDGNLVRRAGWNGKGMFLFLRKNESNADVEYEIDSGGILYYPEQSWVAMKTADDTVVPWLCSQTDLLAVDWELAKDV